MNAPKPTDVVFSEMEDKITTGGSTEIILGIPDSKNKDTLYIPFGYQQSNFDEEKGSISCFVEPSIIEEYRKLEAALLRKAKNMDVMGNVVSTKSSIKKLKDGKEYLLLKCNKSTKYYIFKDGKHTAGNTTHVVKGSNATIAAKILLWKFEVAGKQSMGISLLCEEVMLNGEVKKPTKKRIKTLSYVKQQKKGKIMDHKDLEELNL